MKKASAPRLVPHPDRLGSYFRLEAGPLALVTVSGLVYNLGLAAGPYFEGQLVQRLLEVMRGEKTLRDMAVLALTYLGVTAVVQAARCAKRFWVRRFANDTARSMRLMLYNSLVHKSRAELLDAGAGDAMTKAVADVDACAEGMRKFTTELFDTGVALAGYLALLFSYDARLALIACAFTPAAYLAAGALKGPVTRRGAAYKESAARLGTATLDRVSNAATYRVTGQEAARDADYSARLADYEKRAAASNFLEGAMQPLYSVIAACGVVPILILGARNVLGTGWRAWDIAAFTAFLSCFTKMAVKASHAAKLFNSVQKAQVSWRRVRPLMRDYIAPDEKTALDLSAPGTLEVRGLGFSYPGGPQALRDVTFTARPGEIVGVTGPVACGKSTLGKVFLCETPYAGSVKLGGAELSSLTDYERSRLVSYMGHAPELLSGTVAENVLLGREGAAEPYLRAAALADETAAMPDGENTFAGSGGARLSGGQQARLALARALASRAALLVLDDPFSAVDKKTEAEILQNLRALEKDRIVLLISHRLDLFPSLDRVIWMKDGTARVSDHASLLRDCPEYAALFAAQTEGGDLDEAE